MFDDKTITMENGRAGAMYLRKSRADREVEEGGELEVLLKHQTELTDLSRRLQLPVNDIYQEVVSGESVAARIEFQKLMEGVGQRKYAYVFCHAVDRLGRGDMMEYGWVLSTFQYTHTLIITPGKTYDPANPFDLQQLQLQMFFSNAEYMRIISRFKSGRRASARSGQYIPSRAPFGYDKVEIDGKKTLAPNDNAKHVREIYKRAAAGDSVNSIMRWTVQMGIKTTMGNNFAFDTIKKLVSNPVYKGVIRYGHYVTEVSGREGMKPIKRQVLSDDAVIVDGLHEAIVDAELWQKANDTIHKAPPVKANTDLKNPLAGLLVCKHCGHAMILNSCSRARGRYSYTYIRHRPYTSCDAGLLSKNLNDIIDCLASALEEVAGDYMLHAKTDDGGAKARDEQLEAMGAALAAAEARLGKLVDLYISDAINMDIYLTRKQHLEDTISEISKGIAELSAVEIRPPREIAISLHEAINLLRSDKISAEEKNSALRRVIDHIDYDQVNGKPVLDVYVRD